MWTITGTLGLLIIIGICNDIATFAEIITFASIGFALVLLSVLLSRDQYYIIDFVAPNGKHKKVRAHNLLGKIQATYKYNKLGYKVKSEWEVIE
jgi:hypothetical protein